MLLHQYSDLELLEAMKRDVHKAFDTLFNRYWSSLYGTAFYFLKDAAAAAEVVQDIFLRIWQKRHVYEIHCLKQYLESAARYHVYKQLKAKKSASLSYIADYEKIQPRQKSVNEGEEKLCRIELENTIDTSLKQLPKRCREIFILSRRKQLSNDEIARHLGISKRTVENQLTNALHFLRPIFRYAML
ncbi:RNA polymerase sigma-70 factor [Pedobacter immunditicola]|uniref:RNA polymerase sigma-70 factor n=1 Tax=Pedobacter immunditicola TaxID=3133440 RepID=UPI0030A1214A